MISNKELNEVKLPSGTISQHLPKEKLNCSVGRENSFVVFNYEDIFFENIEQKRIKQPVKNNSTGRYNKSKTARNKNMNNSVKAQSSYKNFKNERSKKIGMQLNSTEYHSPLSYNKKNKSENTSKRHKETYTNRKNLETSVPQNSIDINYENFLKQLNVECSNSLKKIKQVIKIPTAEQDFNNSNFLNRREDTGKISKSTEDISTQCDKVKTYEVEEKAIDVEVKKGKKRKKCESQSSLELSQENNKSISQESNSHKLKVKTSINEISNNNLKLKPAKLKCSDSKSLILEDNEGNDNVVIVKKKKKKKKKHKLECGDNKVSFLNINTHNVVVEEENLNISKGDENSEILTKKSKKHKKHNELELTTEVAACEKNEDVVQGEGSTEIMESETVKQKVNQNNLETESEAISKGRKEGKSLSKELIICESKNLVSEVVTKKKKHKTDLSNVADDLKQNNQPDSISINLIPNCTQNRAVETEMEELILNSDIDIDKAAKDTSLSKNIKKSRVQRLNNLETECEAISKSRKEGKSLSKELIICESKDSVNEVVTKKKKHKTDLRNVADDLKQNNQPESDSINSIPNCVQKQAVETKIEELILNSDTDIHKAAKDTSLSKNIKKSRDEALEIKSNKEKHTGKNDINAKERTLSEIEEFQKELQNIFDEALQKQVKQDDLLEKKKHLKIKSLKNVFSKSQLKIQTDCTKSRKVSENIGDSLSEVINSVACNSELNIQTDDTRSRKISDNLGDSLNEVISSVACNSELNIQTDNTSKKKKSKKIKTLEDWLSKENNSVIYNTELMETDDTKSTTMKSKTSKTIKDSSSNNNLKTKVFSNKSDDLTKEVNAFDTLCQGSAVEVKNKKRKNSASLNNEHKGINTVNVQEKPLLTNNLLQNHGEPERKKPKTVISELTLSSDFHKTREAEALIKEVKTKSKKQDIEKSLNLNNESNKCVISNVNDRLKDTKTRTAPKLSKKEEQKYNQILKSLTNNSLYLKTIEEKLRNEKTIQDEIQTVGVNNKANESMVQLLSSRVSSIKPSPKKIDVRDNKKKKQNEKLELIKESELSKEFVNTNDSSNVIQVPVSPQKTNDKDNQKKKNSSIDIAVRVSPQKSHDRDNKEKNEKLELVKESKLSKEIISTRDSSRDSEASVGSQKENNKANQKKNSSIDIAVRVSPEKSHDRDNKKHKKNEKLELVKKSKLSKKTISTNDSSSDSEASVGSQKENGKDNKKKNSSRDIAVRVSPEKSHDIDSKKKKKNKKLELVRESKLSKEIISTDDSSSDSEASVSSRKDNDNKKKNSSRDIAVGVSPELSHDRDNKKKKKNEKLELVKESKLSKKIISTNDSSSDSEASVGSQKENDKDNKKKNSSRDIAVRVSPEKSHDIDSKKKKKNKKLELVRENKLSKEIISTDDSSSDSEASVSSRKDNDNKKKNSSRDIAVGVSPELSHDRDNKKKKKNEKLELVKESKLSKKIISTNDSSSDSEASVGSQKENDKDNKKKNSSRDIAVRVSPEKSHDIDSKKKKKNKKLELVRENKLSKEIISTDDSSSDSEASVSSRKDNDNKKKNSSRDIAVGVSPELSHDTDSKKKKKNEKLELVKESKLSKKIISTNDSSSDSEASVSSQKENDKGNKKKNSSRDIAVGVSPELSHDRDNKKKKKNEKLELVKESKLSKKIISTNDSSSDSEASVGSQKENDKDNKKKNSSRDIAVRVSPEKSHDIDSKKKKKNKKLELVRENKLSKEIISTDDSSSDSEASVSSRKDNDNKKKNSSRDIAVGVSPELSHDTDSKKKKKNEKLELVKESKLSKKIISTNDSSSDSEASVGSQKENDKGNKKKNSSRDIAVRVSPEKSHDTDSKKKKKNKKLELVRESKLSKEIISTDDSSSDSEASVSSRKDNDNKKKNSARDIAVGVSPELNHDRDKKKKEKLERVKESKLSKEIISTDDSLSDSEAQKSSKKGNDKDNKKENTSQDFEVRGSSEKSNDRDDDNKKKNKKLEVVKERKLSKNIIRIDDSSSDSEVSVTSRKDNDKDNKKKNSSRDIAVRVRPEKSDDRDNEKKMNEKLKLLIERKLSKKIISISDSSSDSEASGSSQRDNDKDDKKKSSSRDIAIRVSPEKNNDRNKKKKKKKLELIRESKLSKEFITTDDSASDSEVEVKVEEGRKDYETASTSCSDGLHLNETLQQTVKTRVKTPESTPEKNTPACNRKVLSKEFISSDDSSDDEEINGSRKKKRKAFRKARDLIKDESDSDVPEDIQRLRSLRIFVPWDVPRVHLIETRMSSVPNPVQIDEFNSLGIKFKKGPYNTAEDEKIKQNWVDFCKDHNLITDPKLFLDLSWPTRASLHTIDKLNFVRYLARDLPNRMLYSIYKRFQTLYTPLKKDKFTEEEDDVILNFYLNSKVRNKNSALGSILNRSRESIKYRHLTLLRDEKTLYWTNELTQDLVDHLLEETRQNNIKDLKDIDITLENWKNIEEKMKITVSKLKRRWYATVYPKLFIDEYRFLNEIRRKLIRLLSKKKFPDRRSIIWSDLAKEFNNITGQRLNRIFSCLVSSYVPKRKRNDLKAIIKILSTSLNYFCDKRIIKYEYKGAKIIFDEPKVKPENKQPK